MKSLFVSAALVAAFVCPAFAATSPSLPTPDAAVVCTPGETITLASVPDKLKEAGDTLVTVVAADDPAIIAALKDVGKSITDIPPGLKAIVGFVIDTPDGSGAYFAHPFDNACASDAGLPLLPDYKPSSFHSHIPLGAPSVLPFSRVPAIPEVTQPQPKTFDGHA